MKKERRHGNTAARWIAFILTGAMALGLAACGSSGANGGSSLADEAESESEAAAHAEEAGAVSEEVAIEEILQSAETEEERLLRYQAYYDKLLELQDKYGEISLESVSLDATGDYSAEVSYAYQEEYEDYSIKLLDYYPPVEMAYSGLCLVQLIDFDGDGTEELLVAYDEETSINDDTFESGGNSGETYDYTVEVYAYKDGEVKSVYKNKPSILFPDSDCYDYSIEILYCEGKCFIESATSNNAAYNEACTYYGYDGEAFYAEISYEIDDSLDWTNFDESEQYKAFEQWYEDVCLRYTCSFELQFYDTTSTINYADCEEAIEYLKEQVDLGLSSDSLNSMHMSSAESEALIEYLAATTYYNETYIENEETYFEFRYRSDGSFDATYRSSADEIFEVCEYTGDFTDFEKFNDNIYIATVGNISLTYEPGTEQLYRGESYIACDVPDMSLAEGDTVVIYLSGTDADEIANDIGISWINDGILSCTLFFDTKYSQSFISQ